MEVREEYLKNIETLKKFVTEENIKKLVEKDYENKKISEEVYYTALEYIDGKRADEKFKEMLKNKLNKTLKERIKVDVNLSKSEKKIKVENQNIRVIKFEDSVNEIKGKKMINTEKYLNAVRSISNYTQKNEIKNFIMEDFKNGKTDEQTYRKAIKLLENEEER